MSETPHVDTVSAREPEPIKPRFELARREGVSIEKFGQTLTYDSFAIVRDGQVAKPDDWINISGKEIVRAVLEISDLIEQNPEVKSFNKGVLNVEQARQGEMVLGFQMQDVFSALSEAALAKQLDEDDLGMLIDYIYTSTEQSPKPFTKDLCNTVFSLALSAQRDELYQALQARKRGLEDANRTIDMLPYGGLFLLEGVPTVSTMAEHFTQEDEEAEKNLVVDTEGRVFLLKGMDKNTGVITYRAFKDIQRDFHTHRISYPFSTGDIGTYKSFGLSRDIYGVASETVDFFVSSPNGVFQFTGNLSESVHAKQDRKNDSLNIPCSVTNELTSESVSFPSYSNHERGECGQYIQGLMKQGIGSMTIQFENGDVIKFQSWEELQRQGKGELPISEINLY